MGCLIVFDGKEIGRGRNNANEDKNATKAWVHFSEKYSIHLSFTY